MATPTLPCPGTQKRVELLRNPCNLRSPQRQAQGQNQKWLPQPCLLGGREEGGIATDPLHSRGSPTKGNKIRSAYLTPAFSGARTGRISYATRVPNAKRQDKIRSARPIPASSGAQKRVELLRNPCNLRGPESQGGRLQLVLMRRPPSYLSKRGGVQPGVRGGPAGGRGGGVPAGGQWGV